MSTRSYTPRTSRTPIASLALALCLSLGVASGCEGGVGGLGVDRLEVQRCNDVVPDGGVRCHAEDSTVVFEPFAMPLRFLGLVVVDNKAFIRMSPVDRTVIDGDQALVVIQDVASILDATRDGGTAIVDLGDNETVAQLTLVLMDRCECPHDPLVATAGTLTLTAFNTAPGTRVAGSLDEVIIRNMRTGETIASGFHGGFDFAVVTTTPWQPFSNPPAHQD